jgi:hypothetical protein
VLPLCVTYHLDVSMYVLFLVFTYLGIFMCVFCCSTLHLVVSRCTCNVCDFQGNFLISSIPPLIRFSPPITACPDLAFDSCGRPQKMRSRSYVDCTRPIHHSYSPFTSDQGSRFVSHDVRSGVRIPLLYSFCILNIVLSTT